METYWNRKLAKLQCRVDEEEVFAYFKNPGCLNLAPANPNLLNQSNGLGKSWLFNRQPGK